MTPFEENAQQLNTTRSESAPGAEAVDVNRVSTRAVADAQTRTNALVHPELLAALVDWPTLEFSDEVLPLARSRPALDPIPAPMPQPVLRTIPGPAGAPDVTVVIVDPNPGTSGRPVLVHTHGGGYIMENPGLYPIIQTIAHVCQCVVVSVLYRLAPETQYPGALEDNYAALQWVYGHADELGIDRRRIAVGGESAGGGHAAALALRARDRGDIPILFQLLIYPMLDDRTGGTMRVPGCMGRHIWTEPSNQYAWTALLGVPASSAQVLAESVPARVEDLSGLPPTWIGTGALDLFAEESVAYASRLMAAGVPTELAVFPGGYHAFDLLVPDAPISKRFRAGWLGALQRAFAQQ